MQISAMLIVMVYSFLLLHTNGYCRKFINLQKLSCLQRSFAACLMSSLRTQLTKRGKMAQISAMLIVLAFPFL